MYQKKNYNRLLIALGIVIRGGTYHFDLVANQSANALSSITLKYGLPITQGILTTETIEQALERAGTKMGNKGAEAALCALEIVSLLRKI